MSAPQQDCLRSFLFDELDIRGAHVRLDASWQAILARRSYPGPARRLLGEMAAVTALITGQLKQPGRITFQLRGDGLLPMLVVDCTATLNLRGHVSTEGEIPVDASLHTLLGQGRMLMTLDVPSNPQPFQSHVPIEGDSMAAVFTHFLEQSEQQPAWLMLAASETGACGLFLQKLPGADQRDADGWSRITQLAQTLRQDELLGLDTETLLTRLFHEETLRLFNARPVTHDFPRDPEKIATMLRSLGRTEIERILAVHGVVEVQDDLSNHHYHFSADEARALFDEPPTLH